MLSHLFSLLLIHIGHITKHQVTAVSSHAPQGNANGASWGVVLPKIDLSGKS